MNSKPLRSRNKLAAVMVDVCRRLSDRGLAVATDGNVSARLPSGNILITRSGVSKGMIREEDLVEVAQNGTGGEGRPSTEILMHLAVYEHRPDVHAVVHAHPPVATSFAVAGEPLDRPVLPEVIVELGPIPLAPYGTPSTPELPESLLPFVDKHNAILLSNHGVITFGVDLYDAYFKMEKVEQAAGVIFRARLLGRVRELSEDQLARLRAVAPSSYGKKARG